MNAKTLTAALTIEARVEAEAKAASIYGRAHGFDLWADQAEMAGDLASAAERRAYAAALRRKAARMMPGRKA
jgi:hypothetical protein